MDSTRTETGAIVKLGIGRDTSMHKGKFYFTTPGPAHKANDLFREYKDVFVWSYKYMRGIPEIMLNTKLSLTLRYHLHIKQVPNESH